MSLDPLDQAINRLARNMSICQAALSMTPPAALFALQIEALESAVEECKQALANVDAGRTCRASSRVIGPYTADLIAETITAQTPTPDTIPPDWKA